MYRLSDIRVLHLEMTTACNAACPMCPRRVLGGRPNPHLPAAELTLQDVRDLLPDEFVRGLDSVYLCGNYGDPVVARDTLAVLEHFRAVQPGLWLGVHTNGAARSPEWWRRLARVVSYCRFGIDGLQDTNHVYRRHTRWETILESVRAFVAAGGRAEWDWIVFRHNEHQIAEARRLAQDLGFAAFYVKETSRFVCPWTGRGVSSLPILDQEGVPAGVLEEPLFAHGLTAVGATGPRPANAEMPPQFDSTPIRCHAVAEGGLYVSSEGLAFPCCWLGSVYRWHKHPEGGRDLLSRIPSGSDALSVRRHGLTAVVEGDVFQEVIPAGWGERPGSRGERLEACARACGAPEGS